MTDYYLTDGAHVLIAGATGAGDQYGGKSVLANWWFEQSVERGWHDLGVYFNPKRLGFVRGQTVTSLLELAEAYRDGARLLDYHVTGDRQAAHAELVEFLRGLPGGKIAVHDEAQSLVGGGSLDTCLAELGNMDSSKEPTDSIRSLVLTQRPWNLPEEHRANMPLKIWVGPFGNEASHFFNVEQMGNAAAEVREETGPYRWSVTDAGDYVETNRPVDKSYAN